MNTTVVTVDRVLLIHPYRLDLDAPDGVCVGMGCAARGLEVLPVLASVDYRHGHGYIPPLDPTGLAVVDSAQLLTLDLCPTCNADLDKACGWQCVPFDLKVVAE